MAIFTSAVVVRASVADVFAFHERPDALTRLSPPFPRLRVVEKTGGIEPGGRVVLRIGGLVRWVALHTQYERNRLFVDEQVAGPFALWRHRHEFAPHRDGTLLTDRVHWRLPGGVVVNVIAAPMVAVALSRMFAYRHAVTKRYCESR